jgi:regulator of protease activity HflC (stomatin/prohibitin superfamily)
MELPKILVTGLLSLTLIVSLVRTSLFRVRDYERLVVFRLGRATAVRGPGVFFLVPFFESGSRFDIRDGAQQKLVAAWQAQLEGTGPENPVDLVLREEKKRNG